jgi:hypothetical protein
MIIDSGVGAVRKVLEANMSEAALLTDPPCRAPLHEEYSKHYGHKGDPVVTPETCATVGERAQVILVWLRASGVRPPTHRD